METDGWTLYDDLKDFDFNVGGGARYTFNCEYDLRGETGIQLLDNDSADASSCVKKLGLSYDINARHYSTVEDGDRITDMVSVEWTFWRNSDG